MVILPPAAVPFRFDILALVNLLAVTQGIFLALAFVLNRRANARANRLLGLFLLLMSLVVLEIFGCYTNLIVYAPWFINLTEPFNFLIGPVLYLYTLTLVRPGRAGRYDWLHALPAMGYAVLRLPYLLQSNAFKLADVQADYHRPVVPSVPAEPIWWFPTHHFGGPLLDFFTFASMIGYAAAGAWVIRQFAVRRGESVWRSSLAPIRWLVRLLTLLGAFLLVALGISVASGDDTGDIYIATGAAAVFYALSYVVLRHSSVLAVGQTEPEKRKYENSRLNGTDAAPLVQKLRHVMQTDRPHLDSNLTLADLAARLSLSTHHLSQLLNEQLGQNFFDFVNEHRVRDTQQRLLDPAYRHLKIEQVAYDCGFNSKSVFNAAFKKAAGVTPSEYRKSTPAG